MKTTKRFTVEVDATFFCLSYELFSVNVFLLTGKSRV